MLCDGVNFEEDLLKINYDSNKKEFNETVFFKTTTQNYFLENFSNDIVLYGGINPYEAVKDNKFYFLLNSTSIHSILIFFSVLSLFNWF